MSRIPRYRREAMFLLLAGGWIITATVVVSQPAIVRLQKANPIPWGRYCRL